MELTFLGWSLKIDRNFKRNSIRLLRVGCGFHIAKGPNRYASASFFRNSNNYLELDHLRRCQALVFHKTRCDIEFCGELCVSDTIGDMKQSLPNIFI